jgi:hypothetical protein
MFFFRHCPFVHAHQHTSRLRKEYRQFNETLGRTGAGLRYEDVEVGSNIWNLIGELFAPSIAYTYRFLEQLEQDFPYWKRLHGFWRTLPNFNPYTASSEPGQDLAAEALTLVQRRGKNDHDDGDATDAAANDDDDGSTQQINIDVSH